MGKKGTKRKTKWRALPLGEEAGGSGNEEELHDDDQSTTSSVVGQSVVQNFQKPQTPFYKAVERTYKAGRRFSYEKNKNREPLVKLESKTFDEEEYTKITTPRQDVLFKKGYFGRKRESSAEKSAYHVGEMEGEEMMMDQIIITNGFVDERGHYLVNGNSYEIYDPYSNTVTVVVGPPPYTNGVTQPVLAAVSCQPVPLQPVDWYPPGSDWPAQGSAWAPLHTTTTTAATTTTASALADSGQNSENPPNFHPPEGQISNLYQPSAYVIPNYIFGETPIYDSEATHGNSPNHVTEIVCSNDNNKLKNGETSITNSNEFEKLPLQKESKDEGKVSDSDKMEQEVVNDNEMFHHNGGSERENISGTKTADASQENIIDELQSKSSPSAKMANSKESSVQVMPEVQLPKVEKQSHSTQTNSIEPEERIVYPRSEVRNKESHSTQTLPEFVNKEMKDFVSKNKKFDVKTQKVIKNNEIKYSDTKETSRVEEVPAAKSQTGWKSDYYSHQNHQQQQQQHQQHQPQYLAQEKYNGKNFHQNSHPMPRKNPEDSFRKIFQKRTNFGEERKYKVENVETSPLKVSYAKKAMAGLEKNNDENFKVVNGSVHQPYHNRISNGWKNAQNNHLNSGTVEAVQQSPTNKINRTKYQKQIYSFDKGSSYDERKNNQNGSITNGLYKSKGAKSYNGKQSLMISSAVTSTGSAKVLQDLKPKENKIRLQSVEFKAIKSPANGNKSEETVSESPGLSEKSSTASELSSPTELSSGQNTPPEKLIVRKMEQKIATEINKSFKERLKHNSINKNAETLEKKKEKKGLIVEEEKKTVPEEEEEEEEQEHQGKDALYKTKIKTDGKKKNHSNNSNKGRGDRPERSKEINQPNGKKKKKKSSEVAKNKSKVEVPSEENSFLPNLIMQEPQKLIFRSWEGMKSEEADMISKMDTVAKDHEILKTLGLNEDKINLTKLPLHSDLLMMLPAFGWSRPKFKVEDMFTSTKQLHHDLFTRRNIISMKSTKPEEFFASVIDSTASANKGDKGKKEGNNKSGGRGGKDHHQGKQEETKSDKCHGGEKENKSSMGNGSKKNGSASKTSWKTGKNVAKENKILKSKEENEKKEKEEIKVENENKNKNKKLGIVEAVNSWLQEQESSDKVLSVDSLQVRDFNKMATGAKEGTTEELSHDPESETEKAKEPDSKNEVGNPVNALFSKKRSETIGINGDFQDNSACMGLANTTKNGSQLKKKGSGKDRKQRSSSLDGNFSRQQIKKHLKYITVSASFCQDLISDVRNGLPVRTEYATEGLGDPKQSFLKCYNLSPQRQRKNTSDNVARRGSCDSENEAFDALEYKFLTQNAEKDFDEKIAKEIEPNDASKKADGVSYKDPNLSESTTNDPHKDTACKVQ